MSRDADTASNPESGVLAEPPQPASTRNYAFGTLNGVVGAVSMDFMHPELILAGLVMALTGSYWLVAFVSIINKAGALLPQLQVSSYLEHRPRKKPFYAGIILVRTAAVAVLLVSIRHMVGGSTGAFAAFYAAYLVWCVGWGSAHVIFMDMVGRLIPFKRVGAFLGGREFLGGILSLAAGWLIIQPILDSNRDVLSEAAEARAVAEAPAEAPAPPAARGVPRTRVTAPEARREVTENYFALAVVGGTLGVLAMGFLALCREEPGSRARHPTTLAESLRRGYRWLREDRDYRTYLWLRISFRITFLALVFFVPFGVERIEYTAHPLGTVALGGVMIAVIKLARVLSSAVWSRVADTLGDRRCLVGAGACFAVGPTLMLLAPHVPQVGAVPIPLTKVVLDLPLIVYLVALVAVGTAFQGSIIGGNRFLIGHAPPHRRISYVGFLNTVTSPLTLLPAVGAWVAGSPSLGLTPLFVGIAGGGVMFLVWALRLSPDSPSGGASR